MLAYPKTKGARREANFSGQPATTWGTTLTAHATPHTEPTTPTQLIAATAFDSYWVNVMLHSTHVAATVTNGLVNIKVGAAASEVTVIENLLAGWASTAIDLRQGQTFGFPLRIPAGSRISATFRALITVDTVSCMIELIGGAAAPHWTGTKVESVGEDTSLSRGTQVTPGAGAEGTFTNLAATVGEFGFVRPYVCGNTDVTETGVIFAADVGIGGVLLPGLDEFLFAANTSEAWWPFFNEGRFTYISAGVTPQMRIRSSSSIEAKSCILYGVS